MKKYFTLVACCILFASSAQLSKDAIRSDFVRYQRRVDFDKNMRERTIKAAFAQPLDSTTEDGYREACWAISQFLLRSPDIQKGFRTLFTNYASLETATRQALLEAAYGVYPSAYKKEFTQLVSKERHPRLFAMQAVYLYRLNHSVSGRKLLRSMLKKQFPGFREEVILTELDHYLQNHARFILQPTPGMTKLFHYRKLAGQKTIYSFQRWDRDQPGLAIIQQADGHFAKDAEGRLLVFEQLARSASDLPYFITNGSTPQGIYSIQGTDVSRNHLIGPTPNIQLVMPNEADSVFWHMPYDSAKDPLANYLDLLPASWRGYAPVTESFYAGKAGRTEIIAHGTAIDPDYFKGNPFYPLTPTMGCLSAKETWNMFTGKLLQSDQFNLANSFLGTPGTTGYLFVLNLDNRHTPVSRSEIEKLVSAYEATQ